MSYSRPHQLLYITLHAAPLPEGIRLSETIWWSSTCVTHWFRTVSILDASNAKFSFVFRVYSVTRYHAHTTYYRTWYSNIWYNNIYMYNNSEGKSRRIAWDAGCKNPQRGDHDDCRCFTFHFFFTFYRTKREWTYCLAWTISVFIYIYVYICTTQVAHRRPRVSSDVRARFPVTVVEKQPERMVVIGDVHGDLGERSVFCTVFAIYELVHLSFCLVPTNRLRVVLHSSMKMRCISSCTCV